MKWSDIVGKFCRKRKENKLDETVRKAVERRALAVQAKYGLEPTGLPDGATLRRALTEHEASRIAKGDHKYITCNGLPVKIEWDKVKLFTEDDAFSLPEKTYRKKYTKSRNPNMFLVHWDVCLSSKICHRVLKNRNLSVHFMIDNDGTIHQLMDTQHAAKHSGSRKVDLESIGVEISDAYYKKYQKTYEQKGFGPRPIWVNDIKHAADKGDEFLGFYDVQIEALKALVKALHIAHGIELQTPKDENGLVKTTYKQAVDAKFKGVICHYHVTKRKIDCAGLELDKIVEEVKSETE